MSSRVLVVGAVLGVLLCLGGGSTCSANESLVGGGFTASTTGEGASFASPVLSDPVTPTGVEVAIDIRPGSERNPVNPKSNGVLPVGILSSETFDATRADPSTVFLEGAPVASPSAHGRFLTSVEDVDLDGLDDLIVKIETELLDLESPTGPATLVGETFEGQPFWGTDNVTIVPPDVANDSWALEAVAACMGSDVVLGYPDGLYRPQVKVTRGQMAVFVARAAAGGDSAVPKYTNGATFTDVNPSNWAYDYVQYTSDAGIVQGYSDGSYQPERTVTRGQMAAFIARAIVNPTGEEGLEGYAAPAAPSFSDVAPDYWSFRHVEYCVEESVVLGYPDGSYRPTQEVTRDQMAVYIARAFDLLQ